MDGFGVLQRELWEDVERLTRQGMHKAADLAVNQQLDRDFLGGMTIADLQKYADNLFINSHAGVESVFSRRTNGVSLSDRIYRNGRAGVMLAAKEVEKGLLLQESAKQIAARVKHLYNPDVPGGQSYAAMRLARTEINNAHHDTTIRNAEALEWTVGFKWHLSGSHPKPDICNEYAEEDHDDLGAGVFRKGNAPAKPHPHCLCYLEVIQMDREDFLSALAEGKFNFEVVA